MRSYHAESIIIMQIGMGPTSNPAVTVMGLAEKRDKVPVYKMNVGRCVCENRDFR